MKFDRHKVATIMIVLKVEDQLVVVLEDIHLALKVEIILVQLQHLLMHHQLSHLIKQLLQAVATIITIQLNLTPIFQLPSLQQEVLVVIQVVVLKEIVHKLVHKVHLIQLQDNLQALTQHKDNQVDQAQIFQEHHQLEDKVDSVLRQLQALLNPELVVL